MPTNEEARIEITNQERIEPKYSNFVQVSHAPHEFTITFCYIDPSKITKSEAPRVEAESFSRIIVSPSLMPSLIHALETNLDSYNESIKKELEKKK